MFVIRADGNSVIGMGHIMRCLTIAEEMKRQGMKPVFVTACEEGVSVIEKRGFTAKLLTTDYRDMMSELPQLSAFLAKDRIKKHVILVDSYQVSEAYYRELRKLDAIACLEDMGHSYPVELLINYNIYAPNLITKYEADKRNRAQKLLLGVSYLPLRKEFTEDNSYIVKEKITDVMITTGGGDALFASRAFTDAFLTEKEMQKENIRYHIISGPFNSHAKEVKELYRNKKQVIVHENVTSMKEIMRQCDVIVTAAGSTIYEVSALGIPMIVFFFAENQRQGAEEIEKKTGVINCGDFSEEPQRTTDKAVEALLRCVREKEYRERLSLEERGLIDGQGAARIAEALFALSK